MPRATEITYKGQVERQSDADRLLLHAGDVALVFRGVARSLAIRCPDGCGSLLSINLDPRSGKAWRVDTRANTLTVYPSVWRDTGCEAHFILWRNKLLWCDEPRSTDWIDLDLIQGLRTALLAKGNNYTHYEVLAQELSANPWEALWACQSLVRRNEASCEAFSYFRHSTPEK